VGERSLSAKGGGENVRREKAGIIKIADKEQSSAEGAEGIEDWNRNGMWLVGGSSPDSHDKTTETRKWKFNLKTWAGFRNRNHA